jgi:error-prone DNA polymerase
MIEPWQPHPAGYVELHCTSVFSFLRAASTPEALVARAALLGMSALALTDRMSLAGVVHFQAACLAHGVRPIIGCELAVADPIFGDVAKPAQLVVLCEQAAGYAQLCALLTQANLAHPDAPVVPFAALESAVSAGLVVLTGGREGALMRLLRAGRPQQAAEVARHYTEAFGSDRVFIELQHHLVPETSHRLRQLAFLAKQAQLRTVATNGVHAATRQECEIEDLLTCVRLGISLDTPHPARSPNEEAYLKSADELLPLFADLEGGREALTATTELARRCELSLLKSVCIAPAVPIPPGETPATYLRALCEQGLQERYASTPAALVPDSPQRRQLSHELAVIDQVELSDFFLCVSQIVTAARAMGIRCSGRGSAANSIVAYLLHITGVDPIAHHLLFERFLSVDRTGMPDIDIDVQSDRREELIHYVERTYSERHAAMVANVITYRPRSALRDAAKALGFPLTLINRMTKVLHHHAARSELPSYEEELAQVVCTSIKDGAIRTRCLQRLSALLELTARLCGLPRHLSLHNGGMVLSRLPLSELLPVRLSANGMRALEVDKDDVERLGLIKFDLLGLRTLGAIEEALFLIEETTGERTDIDHLPTIPLDEATMRLVRAGETLTVFQIESPGQWHLLAQTQPVSFDDLIIQTALFRPGPIVGGFVRPYVTRRQAQHQPPQRDAVQTPWHGVPADDFWTTHPVLGPLLADTEGILLFQEQILEVAHHFAGLSYAQADGFRRAMSHARELAEMEAMREHFVRGAIQRGERLADAERVFGAISAYVGYGFCKSHAAEFARSIYQTAFLKAHYPAHWLAAFLSAQPAGFFPAHTVLEEAKRLHIPVLPPDVNRSEVRFCVVQVGTAGHARWAIRIGLAQIAQVGEEFSRAILWERRGPRLDQERPFCSLTDLCGRLRPAGLTWEAAQALVLSGACDSLASRLTRRQQLWQLRELWPLLGSSGAKRKGRRKKEGPDIEQMPLAWEAAPPQEDMLPSLPTFSAQERVALDFSLLGMSTRPHPMHFLRRQLRRHGIRPIADLSELPEGRLVHVAGWPISAQRPGTAKGMGFVVLEDETGRLPVALPPRLATQMHRIIRSARAVAVSGRIERVRWYRSLFGLDLRVVS